MSDLRLAVIQARYALITASRNPRVLVFGVMFPVVLLVLFGSIFTSGRDVTTHFGGGLIDTKAYFTAGMTAYAIMLQTFTVLAIAVTSQRETGQLKRMRGTPIPAWTFIAAYVLRSMVLVVAMVVALFAIGVVVFGVQLHAEGILGIAVYAALGTACLCTLGIAITIVTPTADAASSVGPFAAVMLSFISGVFIPISLIPGWLQSVGKVFPLYHLADGLQRAVVSGTSATGLSLPDVAVLLAWTAAGLWVAATRFRWEPQGRGN